MGIDDEFNQALSAYLSPAEQTPVVLSVPVEVAAAYGRRAASERTPRDANPFDPVNEQMQSQGWFSGYDGAELK